VTVSDDFVDPVVVVVVVLVVVVLVVVLVVWPWSVVVVVPLPPEVVDPERGGLLDPVAEGLAVELVVRSPTGPWSGSVSADVVERSGTCGSRWEDGGAGLRSAGCLSSLVVGGGRSPLTLGLGVRGALRSFGLKTLSLTTSESGLVFGLRETLKSKKSNHEIRMRTVLRMNRVQATLLDRSTHQYYTRMYERPVGDQCV